MAGEGEQDCTGIRLDALEQVVQMTADRHLHRPAVGKNIRYVTVRLQRCGKLFGVADRVLQLAEPGLFLIVVDAYDQSELLFGLEPGGIDRKSTRLNSSHLVISYAVFCLK